MYCYCEYAATSYKRHDNIWQCLTQTVKYRVQVHVVRMLHICENVGEL